MSEEIKEFSFENEEYRQTYWHTCSHIMAQAVKRLWPEVKLAIGPSIKEGWYYDMDAPFAFTPEHMTEIEAEMRKICKEKLKLERFELPRAEAIQFMEEKEEPFKVELIQDLPEDAHISFYKQGEFTDLCAGLHIAQGVDEVGQHVVKICGGQQSQGGKVVVQGIIAGLDGGEIQEEQVGAAPFRREVVDRAQDEVGLRAGTDGRSGGRIQMGLIRMADYFGVTIDYLVGRSDAR